MKREFREFLKNEICILDGAMGTLLQKEGLPAGKRPEEWNTERPELIKSIHKSYFDSGSNVVSANTFGANCLNFPEDKLEDIIYAALRCASEARAESSSHKEMYIALDIGPTGKLLEPIGELSFEDAVEIFAKTVRIGVKAGAELIFIETMNNSLEAKAAVLAAKENSSLPILLSCAYGEDGKLMTGASPASVALTFESMGVSAIGANCSFGPEKLLPVGEELLSVSSLPVILKPNGGLPKLTDKGTVFESSPEEFADILCSLVPKGLRIMGGCCGTSPCHIAALSRRIKDLTPPAISQKKLTAVCGREAPVFFGKTPLIIGERINPTGKKRLKEAYLSGDLSYVLEEALKQQDSGAHILDLNAGLAGIDEASLLRTLTREIQKISTLPMQLDSADPAALEGAMRVYDGKPMVNSVNGKESSMHAVFPLIKKYGGTAVALTLDEGGIPATAEGRLAVAEKILKTAEEYGIDKRDIVFDTLTLSVSADADAPKITLEALRLIKEKTGCHTVLGLSNVSYGLPARESLNSAFLSLALEAGLSAAIMNPLSEQLMGSLRAYLLLKGADKDAMDYISFFSDKERKKISFEESSDAKSLKEAVERGLSSHAAALTGELLKEKSPSDIVNGELIPALDKVGADYEANRIFLPALMSAAEAAKSAFSVIKEKAPKDGGNGTDKGDLVIATVEGDVHDIGKNIVSLVLENYGYRVFDLGKNVPPETIVNKIKELRAPYAGLSALMTTTLPAMEKTVELIKKEAPFCRVLVGGAVLNEEYARKIGAYAYAPDPQAAIKILEGEK